MNPRMQHRQHHRVHVTRLRTTANGAIRHVERVMRPARVLSASLAVCAIALAACGSASKPSRSGSADTQALQYASCMHSNGITNYPDPTNNGQPQSLNGIDPSAPAVQRAYNACRKHAPNGEAGPPAPSAAELRRALAFARCMRKHGFSNFPDPLTTYGRPRTQLTPAECSFRPYRPRRRAARLRRSHPLRTTDPREGGPKPARTPSRRTECHPRTASISRDSPLREPAC